MNLFSKLLKSLVTNTTNYFDPLKSGTSGFWGSPLAKGLGKIQEGQNFLADKARVDWTSGINTGNKYTDFGARTLIGIPEAIINTPSDINRSGRQIGRDIVSGDIKKPKVLISDIAGAGIPLLNIATLGAGSSLAKQAGKQTITSLLKEGGKQGIKYGAGFGALGGLESGREIVDPKDYLENLALNTAIGVGTGAVLGPAVGLAGKAAPKVYEKYKASPLADERGFIKIGDIVEKSKVGKTIKNPEELNYETIKGENLTKEQSLMTLKNRSASNVALHNKVYNTLSRAGEKSFQGDKARPALGYFIDYIGAKEVEASYKKWLVDPYKPDIASFWSELKYKKDAFDNSYGESLAVNSGNQEAGVPQSVKEPVRALNQPKQPIENRLKSVEETLAPAEFMDQNQLPVFMQYGISELKSMYQDLEKEFLKKGINKSDFVDMIEGKKEVPSNVQSLIDLHRKITDSARNLTEQTEQIGYTPDYFPHENFGVSKVLQEILPSTWIDRLNIGTGFFQERTGKLKDYSKDYSKVMGDYAEQAILKKYENTISPLTQGEQAVIEHVNKLEPENTLDYVTTLNPSTEKPKIKYQINAVVGKDPLRTANDLFSKMDSELFDSFRNVRDWTRNYFQNQKKIEEIVENGDKAGALNFFANMLGFKGEAKTRFMANAREGIEYAGLEQFSNAMLSYSKRHYLNDFIEKASSYEYTNGRTKQFVNDYIDTQLKLGKLEKQLGTKVADAIGRVFALAQIGGNLKVAFTQATEVTRLLAVAKPDEIAYGIRASAFPSKDYGFGKTKTYYEQLRNQFKEDKNIGTEAFNKVSDLFFMPLQKIESWKNRVYANVAEAQGRKQGLSGKELNDFVGDFVYKNAHIADEFNTPIVLKESGLARLAFQYSQFLVKNTFQKIDAYQEKKFAKLTGLILADVINVGIIASVAGLPLNFVIGSIFPTGLPAGPIFTAVPDIIEKWNEYQEAIANGEDPASALYKFRKTAVGNLVPGGAQINKTLPMIQTLERGYGESNAGNPTYPAPTNPLEQAQGLIFGPSSTKSSKDYYEGPLGETPMGENEREAFANIEDPTARKQFYDTVVEGRLAKKEQKKTINSILGGATVDPKSSSDAINTPNGGVLTIDEIIARDKAESEKNEFITKVLYGEWKEQSPEVKENLLKSQGITDTDIQNYYTSKLKSSSVEDRAAYIASQKDPNFTQLYKLDVLTPQVAQELERKGIIPDADQLMENLKMTDVYYQRKAIRKLQQSKIKDMIKLQSSQSKKLFNAQLKSSRNVRDILAKATKRKRPKYKKVALPNPYKRKIV